MRQTNLVEILNIAANTDRGITFVSGKGNEKFLCYCDLLQQALQVLELLRSKGIKPGDELIMQIDDNETFLSVFWACVIGQIIPVPVSVGYNAEHKRKIINIWSLLRSPYMIGKQITLTELDGFIEDNSLPVKMAISTRFISLDSDMESLKQSELGKFEALAQPQSSSIAFIQFSSGSTGNPKGVVLTHQNLIANLEAITEGAAITDADKALSWLPLTHDMGLIGFHLGALFNRLDLLLIPTDLFIRRPTLWFDKIHEHRVTLTSSPNFGYKHFMNFFRKDTGTPWDLRCVRLIFNGAEPISPALCREFLTRMAPFGLNRQSIFNVYGLAEASLAVSFSPVDEGLRTVTLDRNQLFIGSEVRELTANEDQWELADLGYPVLHCSVRISDEQGRPLPERRIGIIHIRGENVTSGYYNCPVDQVNLHSTDGWLNTGDLGVILDGRLVVTGRAKDILFVNGQNFYPTDIEAVAEEVDGIELGKIAACGLWNSILQSDELVLFVWHKRGLDLFMRQAAALRKRISLNLGLEVRHVIPVMNMPKTTSGKIQRFTLIQRYEEGQFNEVIQQMEDLFRQQEAAAAVSISSAGLERELMVIWQKCCPEIQLGPDDNFFEAGANSLIISQLSHQLETTFNRTLSVTDLFAHPTITQLANFMTRNELPAIPSIHVPTILTACSGPSLQKKAVYFTVQGPSYHNLSLLCEEQQITIGEYLTFCLGKVISPYTNASTISINTMIRQEDCIDLSLIDTVNMELQEGSRTLFRLEQMNQLKHKKVPGEAAIFIYDKSLKKSSIELDLYFETYIEFEHTGSFLTAVCYFDPGKVQESRMKHIYECFAELVLLQEGVEADA